MSEESTGAAPRFAPAAHVRSREIDDGVVLLDLERGKYFTFNGSGAAVWRALCRGATLEALERELASEYPSAGEDLAQDIGRLLETLRELELIRRVDPLAPDRSAFEGPANGAREPAPAASPAGARPSGRRRPSRWGVGRSYLLLLGMDVALKVLGFPRFCRWSRRWAAMCRGRRGAADVAGICSQIDTAARFYPKRAWCLQRSAATAWRLRWNGVPATLVIGAKRVPFLAHAWVEVGGQVVNDDPRVARFYQVLERL